MEEESNHEKNPIIVFFTNLIGAIKIHFPVKNKDEKIESVNASSQAAAEPIVVKAGVVEDESSDKPPSVVTYPRQSFVPLKLEAEAEDSERTTNPLLLWQVYAIGGFFVMRWAWTRWNERKKPDDDDEPPPSQD